MCFLCTFLYFVWLLDIGFDCTFNNICIFSIVTVYESLCYHLSVHQYSLEQLNNLHNQSARLHMPVHQRKVSLDWEFCLHVSISLLLPDCASTRFYNFWTGRYNHLLPLTALLKMTWGETTYMYIMIYKES